MTTEIVSLHDDALSVIRFGSGQTACPCCGQKPQPYPCMMQITGHGLKRPEREHWDRAFLVMCFPCFLHLTDYVIAFALTEGHHTRPGEVPRGERIETERTVALTLVNALARVLTMHQLMMDQANHADSAYDASCLREMNEAPIVARKVLSAACAALGAEVPRHG